MSKNTNCQELGEIIVWNNIYDHYYSFYMKQFELEARRMAARKADEAVGHAETSEEGDNNTNNYIACESCGVVIENEDDVFFVDEEPMCPLCFIEYLKNEALARGMSFDGKRSPVEAWYLVILPDGSGVRCDTLWGVYNEIMEYPVMNVGDDE